jgi:predicted secreted protein
MRRTPLLLAPVLLLAGACGDDDVSIDDLEDEDRTADVVLDPSTTRAEVDVGDVVRIEVPENASVGDDWDISDPPSLQVVQVVGETYEPDDPEATGSGGTRIFALGAMGQGETEVTLRNCYRCDASGRPAGGESFAETLRFEITVSEGAFVGLSADDASLSLTEERRRVEIGQGELAVIEVEENASVGDDWQIWNAPDPSVVGIVGETFEPDDPAADGSGGTLRILLSTLDRGETTIRLHNCFRCDAEGQSSEPGARDLEFRIRVT